MRKRHEYGWPRDILSLGQCPVFLGRRSDSPAGRISERILMAGDVERNPGPFCSGCTRKIASNITPVRCSKCGEVFHGSCTRENRSQIARIREDREWACHTCKDQVQGGRTNEAANRKLEKEREEVRKRVREGRKCKECGKRMALAKVIIKCKVCQGLFHQKCVTDRTPEDEECMRNLKWCCKGCTPGNERRGSEEENVTEDEKGRDRKGEWRKTKKDIKILQWNADGIGNKHKELGELLKRLKIDVATIQESKLSDRSSTPQWERYTTIRKDRQLMRKGTEMKGGGLLTLVKKDIPYRRLSGWKGGTTEGLRVAVDTNRREKITITNIYRPPIRHSEVDGRVKGRVKDWMSRDDREVICGDFNLHDTKWGSREEMCRSDRGEVSDLIAWCDDNEYHFLNSGEETCFDRRTGKGSIPDVTMVAKRVYEGAEWEVLDELGSDHKPILIKVRCKRETKCSMKDLTWAWRRADWDKYKVECEARSEIPLSGGVASKNRQLTAATLEAARLSIPQKVTSRRNRPYWDEELDELNKERNSYRKRGNIDIEKWKEKTQELTEKLAKKKKAFWKEFVKGLKEDTDSGKVWNAIKSLSTGVKEDASNEVLIEDGREMRSDKQKAECFIKKYAEVNTITIEKEERVKRAEVNQRLRDKADDDDMKRPFDFEEMSQAIEQMEEGKKGGPDLVEAALLTRMPDSLRKRWLEIFNECWDQGRTPGEWKKAEIVPILKAGKDPKKTDSFRPVSLTSVIAKLMERMVANRLWYWLENKRNINPWQAGFQRGRSTEEQICRIVQDIQDGWEEPKHQKTVVVTLDCSKAYDKVWRVRLIERMLDEGVPKCMIRWFNNFLEGRHARVRVGNGRSKWRRMKEGLPQGAVTSPMLFLLYANEWDDLQVEGVKYSGFADDLAIWATGRSVEEIKRKIQEALDKIATWARKAKIQLNPTKSECCLYTRDSREKGKDLGLKIDGKDIATHKEVLFLGVIIDQGLTFQKQVDKVCSKARKRIAVLKALTGREWGWNREELMKVYSAIVESCFWYASAAWMPWLSKTNIEKMEKAQREALRVVTGLTKSTPNQYIYLEAKVTPIGIEAKRRALVMYEKAMRGKEDDPRRAMCEKRGRRRLQCNKGWRDQAREECERIVGGPRLKFSWERRAPWNNLRSRGVDIRVELKEKVKKGSTSEEEMRRVTAETIEDLGPFEMTIATDGSVEEGISNGGAACVTEWRGERRVVRKAAGRWCSSFVAEKIAMEAALEVIQEVKPGSVLIMSDSQALLTAMKQDRCSLDERLERTKRLLWETAENTRVVIQWVPGHVGIRENEWADQEANEARREEQREVGLEFKCAKRRIYRAVKQEETQDQRAQTIYREGVKRAEDANRKSQVLLAQLRAGHCGETIYYQHRIGLREDERCEDCGETERKDHWLSCPRWERVRQEEEVSVSPQSSHLSSTRRPILCW